MNLADVAGISNAQRLARAVIHDVAATLAPGTREIDAVRQIETRLERAGVKHWLHTAYAWWGARTRFAGFVDWEPDALATSRVLEAGDPFILDVAPLVDGYPADYAFSGVCGAAASTSPHAEILATLAEIKRAIVAWAASSQDGAALTKTVDRTIENHDLDVVHTLYPAGVLGHAVARLPAILARAPRIGDGFQLPLLGSSAVQLFNHRFRDAPYPLINNIATGRPLQGLYAIEPHVARGDIGAKFESILLVDGDETRWLDPELFGEVQG
ncbi:MAG: aminopeptidase P family protein [Deltaproteobacteria bacterium]|nr:aminopeptidase P family protein [Deltaproteobacteria bacterium]